MMVTRSTSLRTILSLVFASFLFTGCPPTSLGPDPDATEDLKDGDVNDDLDAGLDELEPDICDPMCEERNCGPAPKCGVICGECEEDWDCSADGICEEAPCVPECDGLECGVDPECGEECGTCDDGFLCEEGACVECQPDCTDLECGPDPICGDECGDCEEGYDCTDEGVCEEPPCTECCLDCEDHPDCEDVFSEDDLGACLEPKCVYDEDCTEWQCMAVPVEDPLCCGIVDDCPPPNECSDVDCIQDHCVYTKIEDCCLVAPALIFALDFDDIEVGEEPPGVAMVIDDENPLDNVTWTVQEDPCGEGMALYLGDPACETYYNGEMWDCGPIEDIDCTDTGCPPGSACDTSGDPPAYKCTGESSIAVAFEATVPEVILPADAYVALFFSVRTDLEPIEEIFAFDTLKLFVEHTPDPDLPPVMVELYTVPQSTDGDCTVFAADLTTFTPVILNPDIEVPDAVVKLIWRFDTFDGENNHHPGLWLDDIRVQSYCDDCQSAASCDDEDVCTSNSCVNVEFGGDGDNGICYNPQLFDNCVSCGAAEDCEADAPECYLWECGEVEGYCLYTPDPECCEVPVDPYLLDAGLEEAELPEEWEVEVTDPPNLDNPDVTWQVHNATACDGSYSLYFGNGENYDCGQASCAAQVTTPEIDLTDVEDIHDLRLSFCVNLSTEWDDVEPGQYPTDNAINPQIDVLYVEVLVGDEITEVWNSDVLAGTTYGAWKDAWTDLSSFKGETIRLRFRFYTGTAEPANNDNAGVFIDNIRVEKVCGAVCGSSEDCTGGADCTSAVCDFGVCAYPIDPECCTAEINPDCDDDNECTNDACQLGSGTCVHTFTGDPDCCVPTPSVFADSFLSAGNVGWDVPESLPLCGEPPFQCEEEEGENCMTCPSDCGACPVGWGITSDQSFTAPYSMYFGNPETGDYENGQESAQGFIAGPDVDMPPYGIPAVSFHLWLETEHSWPFFEQQVEFDILRLYVQEKAGGTYGEMTEIWNSMAWDVKGSTWDPATGAVIWKTIYVGMDGMDLTDKTVRFVFEFDSLDDSNNDFQGAYVDDFKVFTLCDDAYQCLSAYECPETIPAEPNCSMELCGDADGSSGVSGTCYAVANDLLEDCCAQEVIGTGEMASDFDAPCGMEDWVASPTPDQTPVAWQTWDEYNKTPGGECALYFGNPDAGNYDNPGETPQGKVTSPTWEIPAVLDDEVEVSFWLWMHLEDEWSLTDVLTLHMGLKWTETLPPEVEILLWSKPCDLDSGLCDEPILPSFEALCENYCVEWGSTNWPWGQWKQVTINLPTAQLSGFSHLNFWFTFNAQDDVNNQGVGIFVDDFEVLTTCQ